MTELTRLNEEIEALNYRKAMLTTVLQLKKLADRGIYKRGPMATSQALKRELDAETVETLERRGIVKVMGSELQLTEEGMVELQAFALKFHEKPDQNIPDGTRRARAAAERLK